MIYALVEELSALEGACDALVSRQFMSKQKMRLSLSLAAAALCV